VVANTAGSLSSDAPVSQIWIPAAQDYSPRTMLVVRTSGDPRAILDLLRRALRGVGRDVAIVDVQTLRDAVGAILFPIRLTALILGVLGALGFSIALIGVYGVMAYAVGRRTREFGIHRALGATPRQIHVLVLRQGVRMLAVGLASGLVLALAAASLLRHLLYGITPFDPPTFITVPAILFLAGLAAAYFPARRAARVEPVVALRES
jgi:ABC-type antimicrobial peptide transport system permease subunit